VKRQKAAPSTRACDTQTASTQPPPPNTVSCTVRNGVLPGQPSHSKSMNEEDDDDGAADHNDNEDNGSDDTSVNFTVLHKLCYSCKGLDDPNWETVLKYLRDLNSTLDEEEARKIVETEQKGIIPLLVVADYSGHRQHPHRKSIRASAARSELMDMAKNAKIKKS